MKWSRTLLTHAVTDQWRRRPTAFVSAKGGHFEHNLYKTAHLAHRLILAVE